MKRLNIALVLLLVWLQPLSAAGQTEVNLQDCKILLIFVELWKSAPEKEREKAVWIVSNYTGDYETIHWLNTPQRNKMIWSEVLPPNILAVVHTHGSNLDPKPSAQDIL